MTTLNVRKELSKISDERLAEIYFLAPRILINTYLMLGEGFIALDPDFPSDRCLSYPKLRASFPRRSSTIYISQDDFIKQLPDGFDNQRSTFSIYGKAYFEEQHLNLEFHQRVCSWVQPLHKSGVAALVPSVARELVDRIYPQHNTQPNNALPIFDNEIEERAYSLGVIKPILTTLRYVWENNRPLLCSLKNGHYSEYETALFHDYTDFEFQR